ncbi:5-histidylcysteine sulfoxide synthase [Marinicella sp. W31]|uniref:5-histidylcysteine sulfoxide synthase n=1 Tax=Marinicella sp. W31 TaxID=3023713 RepID=UPI003756492F
MHITKTPIINQGSISAKRAEIKRHFHNTYDIYESLFTCLKSDNVYYERPEPLRHPLIFYLGHTAVFYTNKLRVAKIIDERVDDHVESMMAIGVDEMSWDDLNDANYNWPTVEEVFAYRRKVRDMVDQLIDELPMQLPISWNDPFWIILMGIEHERIHLETSSVLIRQLPIDQVVEQPEWPICQITDKSPPENKLIHVDGGTVEQGKQHPSETYGWDNEYGQLNSRVDDFKASQFLVSNQEYLAFVEDGGYKDKTWWTEEGWQWRNYKNAQHPVFWVLKNDQWQYRTMCKEIDMPWSWPVDVNYLEAKAFCNWLAARTGEPIRLPTEPEWYRLYDSYVNQDYPNWHKTPGNIHLDYFASSCPVDQFMFGKFGDVIGNVWQWTETAIDGLEGFEVHPAYDDFSVPTFDGKHNLIKGGSWVSAGNEALRESRYAFRRHFFQHAGFRYVESETKVTQDFNTYETDELISQYLEFHYGSQYFDVPNFPKACIDIIHQHLGDNATDKALDIGCAVGRSSFELARLFKHVDALDFSTRFIRNAINLVEHGEVKYMITDEGELTSPKSFNLDSLELGDKVHNIDFAQGDACNLKPQFSGYDLVFAGNLIDRLYTPQIFLEEMKARINANGMLVITSPYTWLEEYTDKENWLGGFKDNGENLTTLDALKAELGDTFELIADPYDVPFVIRETARKFQHTIAQLTLWKKKA